MARHLSEPGECVHLINERQMGDVVKIRKLTSTILVFGVLFFLAGNFCCAQEKARRITLEECIQLGLGHSPSLQTASTNIIASEAGVKAAKALRIPTLSASAEYNHLSDEPQPEILIPTIPTPITLGPEIVDTYMLQLELKQSLFSGLSIRHGIEKARSFLEQMRYDYQSKKLDVVHSVEEAYWNLAKSAEGHKVIEDHIGVLNDHIKETKNFYDQGMVTYNEVLRVELQHSQIRQQALMSENDTEISRQRLNLLIGLPQELQTVPITDLTSELNEPGELGALLEKALNERPLVRAMSKQIKVIEADLKLIRSSFYPNVYLTGSYSYGRPNPRLFPQQNTFSGSWEIGLVTEMDFGSWRTILFEQQKTKAQKSQLESDLKELKDSITLAVTNAYLTLNMLRQQLAVADQAILQAEENFRIVSEKYMNGLALNSELLDAEYFLLQAKLDRTNARIDYELASINLKRAVGE
jgi:outer membrane protein